MKLSYSVPFDQNHGLESFLDTFPTRPAVFALLLRGSAGVSSPPYLSRTRNLRWRLARLLLAPRKLSRALNLRDLVVRIDYQSVGSSFEAQWLLYLLNRFHYPTQYRERLRLKPPALLKVSLTNRFPRCYPTRRLASDGSLYYGPFPSLARAERFAAEFLDFFKVRRCIEDLEPDPSHPGCIYSQLRMCLAPCFSGCTDAEYQSEVGRVVEFLDAQGQPLLRALEAERAQACDELAFEQAAKIHRRIEKVDEVLRQKPELVRNVRDLHALVVQRGAEPKSVVFFRVRAGELRGAATLSLDENIAAPAPLDEQLRKLLDLLAVDVPGDAGEGVGRPARHLKEAGSHPPGLPAGQESCGPVPPWEHLSLLARWYYSSYREGELVMLGPDQAIPHRRLIRTCRKLVSSSE
jgi:excinuclease ABC subunit C